MPAISVNRVCVCQAAASSHSSTTATGRISAEMPRTTTRSGYIDDTTRAIFGRSYAAEPDVLNQGTRRGTRRLPPADTLLLTVPNTLGVGLQRARDREHSQVRRSGTRLALTAERGMTPPAPPPPSRRKVRPPLHQQADLPRATVITPDRGSPIDDQLRHYKAKLEYEIDPWDLKLLTEEPRFFLSIHDPPEAYWKWTSCDRQF